MIRALALFMIADGLTTAAGGHAWLRWLRGQLPWIGRRVAGWFLVWPESWLRGGALLELAAGWWLFRR